MELVAEAVGTITEQVAVLSKAAEELSHRELIGMLAELTTVLRSVPAVEHKVLSRLTEETEPCRLGESSWKKVLTTALRVSGADAARRLKRAKTLGPRRAITGEPLPPLWEATAAAQAQGLLDAEHVEVIADFHRALPAWVDVGTRAAADAQLATLACGVDPRAVARAARRLLGHVDADGPTPEDAERERARKRGITVGEQQPDGMSRISGYLTPQARAVWDAVFAALAAPGANTDEDGPDTRTPAQRRHDAFLTVGSNALSSGELGTHNGLPTTVIVSTTLQELQKGAGVAVTGGGSLLPMRDLIRMAARAHHYLYVYDQHSGQSLYLGRSKRLATAAQRIVLHARDRGCTRPGCSAPGYWCQVHHATADWKDGGHTDIDDLTFACPSDHRMLDKTGWSTTRNTKNQTEWIPPPELDTGQHRINGYHHPDRYLLPEDDQGP
ncbi:HNH endonuclease signature motif containing protein [Mycobacterium sp. ITM-2016-00317]|uniref:HNH endonuclease signature motif containing protein n=1 Tax=Mycobacterium sp. ITM-2016-00317 TaxID=2099694 RepID=UPI000D405DE7|nr:HNH endonuclease signature motif containing protein [Mycobacterium sp. ITM-2016-00317]WNG89208.1 HNH endonuclease signature motif containing protein [Mycobacterium sp. ITM-2016-00317]